MWFCYRDGLNFRNALGGYQIGYAWSLDSKTWTRDDSRGRLEKSPEGWDSEMVCYPRVIQLDCRLYMFYSGNYFGRDGFGLARLKHPGDQDVDKASQ